MATAGADPLRSTLDNLQLDPSSAADRPYLVAMLRRLGYTEREIDEVVRTGKMPAAAPAADDGMAPARDYRLVIPARDSRFALDNVGSSGSESPFEDLETVEFEDPSQDLEFTAPTEGGDAESEEAAAAREGLEWQDTQSPEALAAAAAAAAAPDERTADATATGADAGFDESAIDTFGGADVAGRDRTRVRVRRVRAASREDAERKVAGAGRKVIKSVPVDIVERWGANAPKKDAAKPSDPEGKA
jgi:hypothetical protein